MGAAWSALLPYASALAALVALVRTPRLREREPGLALRQRLGLLLTTAPLFTLVGVGLASLPALAAPSVAAAVSPDVLTSKALIHLSVYLAVPLAGLALTLGERFPAAAREALAPGRRALARGLRDAAVISAGLGAALLGAWTLVGGAGGLLAANGASVFFSRTTPLLALSLSAIAALAEEVMFRGVVLEWLADHAPAGLAVGVQAAAFGLIHAGYGSLAHVAAAAAFGALMGVLALRRGLAAAIATHLLVNLVILSLWSGHRILLVPAALLALAALAVGLRLDRAPSGGPATDAAAPGGG